MRTLLFTGKGGVGKTTAAAATATLGARSGMRTLVLSTDAAHSLADAFGVPVGSDPTEVDDRLHVHQGDAQGKFEQSWGDISTYLLSVLDAVGVDRIAAEELTVLPGAEEVLALLEVRDQARSGRFDLVVVDCAPTAETFRLLALPEALGWDMGVIANRIFPAAGGDAWRREWVASQAQILTEVESSFAPLEVWRSAYQPREPVGLAELARFATQLYASNKTDPLAAPTGPHPVEVRRDGDALTLRVSLPFADRGAVDLARHGDELVVTVGSYRRLLALPVALRSARVVAASVRHGALVVDFVDDDGAPRR